MLLSYIAVTLSPGSTLGYTKGYDVLPTFDISNVISEISGS